MGRSERFEEPANTRESLMRATYLALCEHGYADLTIQRISEEFPKSKSLLYHHYDGKDELLTEFLSYMLDHFETAVPCDSEADADAQLSALLDHTLPAELDSEQAQFVRAMIELRAQAATNTNYQAHFTRTTEFFHDQFVSIIEQGIAEGTFQQVDSDRVASLLVTTIEGAMLQRATTTETHAQKSITAVRRELSAYLDYRLRTDEATG